MMRPRSRISLVESSYDLLRVIQEEQREDGTVSSALKQLEEKGKVTCGQLTKGHEWMGI